MTLSAADSKSFAARSFYTVRQLNSFESFDTMVCRSALGRVLAYVAYVDWVPTYIVNVTLSSN